MFSKILWLVLLYDARVFCVIQAKLVASATSNLCEAANVVVQGNAQEEKLIVAAKAVAASTAQLLISCQVKADTNSESNRRLQVSLLHFLSSGSLYHLVFLF